MRLYVSGRVLSTKQVVNLATVRVVLDGVGERLVVVVVVFVDPVVDVAGLILAQHQVGLV